MRISSIGSLLVLVATGVGVVGLAACGSDATGQVPIAAAGAPSGSAGAAGNTTTTAGAAGAVGGGSAGTMASAGSSGAGPAAGSGGGPTATGGAAGAPGASGAAGAGMSGGRPSGPSAGCTAPLPPDPIHMAVQHDLMVNVADKYKPTYVTRKYYTSLPTGWDPTKPYPVIFYGQGCGQTGPESGPFSNGHFATDVIYVQLIPAAVTGMTVVPPKGSPGCFQAGRQGLADSPDGPYFDQALAEIEAKYCVDKGKVYMGGWSSGAWLSNYLACSRGNVITGTVSGSGGLQHDHGTCVGGAGVMIFPGDAGSTQEDGFDIGAGPARDTFLKANGCAATSTMKPFGTTMCQVFDGCKTPVSYCTAGAGHGGPLAFIGDSGWDFWKSLP